MKRQEYKDGSERTNFRSGKLERNHSGDDTSQQIPREEYIEGIIKDALLEALQSGDVSKQMLKEIECYPLVSQAAFLGKEIALHYLLLTDKWNPNIQLPDGRTSLMIAVRRGHTNIINFLLSNGADPTICDQDGRNALMIAVVKNDSKSFSILWHHVRQSTIIINHADMMGRTLLLIAVEVGSIEFVKFFLSTEGVDMNWQRHDGLSPLMLAAQLGYHLIVKHMILSGCDLFLEDENGATALCLAVSRKHRQTIDTFYSEISAEMRDLYAKSRIELLSKPRRTCSNILSFYKNILVLVLIEIKNHMKDGLYLLHRYRIFFHLVKCASRPDAADLIDVVCYLFAFLLYSKSDHSEPVIPEMIDNFVEAGGPAFILKVLESCHSRCVDEVKDTAFIALQTVCETPPGCLWLRYHYLQVRLYMNVFESRLADLKCWIEGIETKARVVFQHLKKSVFLIMQKQEELLTEFLNRKDGDLQEKFPLKTRHDTFFSLPVSPESKDNSEPCRLRGVLHTSTPVKNIGITSCVVKLEDEVGEPLSFLSKNATQYPRRDKQSAPTFSSKLGSYAEAVKKNLRCARDQFTRRRCTSRRALFPSVSMSDGSLHCKRSSLSKYQAEEISRKHASCYKTKLQSSLLDADEASSHNRHPSVLSNNTDTLCDGNDDGDMADLYHGESECRRSTSGSSAFVSHEGSLSLTIPKDEESPTTTDESVPQLSCSLVPEEVSSGDSGHESKINNGLNTEPLQGYVEEHHSEKEVTETAVRKLSRPELILERITDLVCFKRRLSSKRSRFRIRRQISAKMSNLLEILNPLVSDQECSLDDAVSYSSEGFEKQLKLVFAVLERLKVSITIADVVAFLIHHYLLSSSPCRTLLFSGGHQHERAILKDCLLKICHSKRYLQVNAKHEEKTLCVLAKQDKSAADRATRTRRCFNSTTCKYKKSYRSVYTVTKHRRTCQRRFRAKLKRARIVKKCHSYWPEHNTSTVCQQQSETVLYNDINSIHSNCSSCRTMENVSNTSSNQTASCLISDKEAGEPSQSTYVKPGRQQSWPYETILECSIPSHHVSPHGRNQGPVLYDYAVSSSSALHSCTGFYGPCPVKLEKKSRWHYYLSQMVSIARPLTVVSTGQGSVIFSSSKDHSLKKGCFQMHVGLFHHGLPTIVKCLPNRTFQEHETLSVIQKVQSSGAVEKFFTEIYDIVPHPGEKCRLVLSELCEFNLSQYLLHIISEPNPKFAVTGETFDGKLLVKQFIEAMKFLHQLQYPVLHGHLKPCNLLVTSYFQLKVTDYYHFDACPLVYGIQIDANAKQTASPGQISDFCWRPPELITSQSAAGAKEAYTKSSDVYVAGMLVYYILSVGHHPYGTTDTECQTNITAGNLTLGDRPYDIESRDMIQCMLHVNPADRLTFSAAFRHPYFWNLENRFYFLLMVEEKIEQIKKNGEVFNLLRESCVEARDWLFYARKDLVQITSSNRTYSNNFVDLLHFAANLQRSFLQLPQNLKRLVVSPAYYILGTYPSIFMSVYDVLRSSQSVQEDLKLTMFF